MNNNNEYGWLEGLFIKSKVTYKFIKNIMIMMFTQSNKQYLISG